MQENGGLWLADVTIGETFVSKLNFIFSQRNEYFGIEVNE